MFGNQHLDRVRESFSNQFEPDQQGFVYRKSSKGAAIRVTASERATFVTVFDRRLRYLIWSTVGATCLLIAGLVMLLPDTRSVSSDVVIYGGVGAVLVVCMLLFYAAWNQPARDLERHAITAQPLTRQEAARAGLAKMTYGQLGLAALMAVVLVGKAALWHDVLHGWNILWLVFGGLLIVVASVQAYRKWRFEETS